MSNKAEDRVTVQDIASDIMKVAYSRGEDAQVTWDKWLEWMCEGLDAKHVIDEGVHAALERMMKDNEQFFGIMQKWFVVANENMRKEPGLDAFGTIYEAAFKSNWKAKSGGQFYTPTPVCQLMARICGNAVEDKDGIIKYNDCAVGSGRTMLAAWNVADKYAKNYFEAGDIDSTSVRMCALNFMMNGMVGCVSLQDAMSLKWSFGYIVNACKVPFCTNVACVEYFDDEQKFCARRERLLELMKDWDIGEHRPKSETKESENAERENKETVVQ